MNKINVIFGFVNIKKKNNVIDIRKYKSMKVSKYLENFNDKKILDAFLMVKLSDKVIDKNLTKLSSSEIIKLELVVKLLNNEDIIYLNNFDKYFIKKDRDYFKKLFKKLCTKYHKTFVFTNVKMDFIIDFAHYIFIFTDDGMKKYDKFSFYNIDKKYINKALIMDLVIYMQKKGKNIGNIYELGELLKAIYREV